MTRSHVISCCRQQTVQKSVRDVISCLRRRGCRGGERHSLAGQSRTSPVIGTIPAGKVPTTATASETPSAISWSTAGVTGDQLIVVFDAATEYPSHNSSEEFQRQQRVFANVLRTATDRTVMSSVVPTIAPSVGLFNAQSMANKFASVSRWIVDSKLSVAALVETCH